MAEQSDPSAAPSTAAAGGRPVDLRIAIEPQPTRTEVDAIAAALAILRRATALDADPGAPPAPTRWAAAGRREAHGAPGRLRAGWHRRSEGRTWRTQVR